MMLGGGAEAVSNQAEIPLNLAFWRNYSEGSAGRIQ